jgi:hypothetical protein
MPNPKRGTVREDMDVAVQEAKGLMDWREDRQGHVRAGEFLRPLANCRDERRLIITLLRRCSSPCS